MKVKTFGAMHLDKETDKWVITQLEPHVCIRLKQNFLAIPKGKTVPFTLDNRPDVCADLFWFLQRYMLVIAPNEYAKLKTQSDHYHEHLGKMEAIMMPDTTFGTFSFIGGCEARDYQRKAYELHKECKRFLLGDDLGLGKTITGMMPISEPDNLPAAIVVPVHLIKHWQERLKEFLNIEAHIIKTTKPYDLPKAAVYIFSYSKLAGWADVFKTGFFKYACFDEIQDLRKSESNKYWGGWALSRNANKVMGMSATPMYNYADEIFNILNLIKEHCLGEREDFLREWAPRTYKNVNDPAALGTFLREQFLFVRRTRADVGRELPPVNKVVYDVDYDEKEVQKSEELSKQLAIKVLSGSFMERGSAMRELDIMMRMNTGIAKAKHVASFVRMLLENGESVLLGGWHREVYDIWLRELAGFNPVMYTGTESVTEKERTKKAFMEGKSKLIMMSLRSGVGVDGLQYCCKYVVYGELDWSPKVHDQFTARVDRDGQQEQVTAIFLTCSYGSDPVMIDLLGLKAAQQHNIINPMQAVPVVHSDESRIKLLAERFLAGLEKEKMEV